MSRLFTSMLCFGLGLSVGASGCQSEPQTPAVAPHQALSSPPPSEVLRMAQRTEAQTLTAGFSSVDITWRAGAKPGQVGTSASTVQISRLWKDLISVIKTVYKYQRQNQPVEGLVVATDWTVGLLEQRVQDLPYDQYVDVFEPGRGIHTPSTAKAIVVESNGVKVALVRVDLYLMQKSIWRRVAELVSTQTGIPAERILITASHNHSAASAVTTAAGIATFADSFDARHFVWITQKIAEAIRTADSKRVPAKLGAVRTTLRATQRNIIGPATAEVIPPGGTTPVTVNAGYPSDFFDDDLFLLTFQDASTSKGLATYMVYATHPESLKDGHGLLSSDFLGGLETALEKRWGYPVMWTPGALGDVEQDNGNNFGVDYWREDFSRLEQQVDTLVNAIGPILEQPPRPGDLVLSPRGDIAVDARLRVYPGAANTSYPGPTAWQLPVTEYLSPEYPVTAVRALTESANIMLQAIRLGDVLLLASPSEVTTDMAKHIKSRTDNVVGNLYQGYVWPDAEAWVEDEISQNFDSSELNATSGFSMPVLLGQANDYMGYMVTRWEYNNRKHYRQEMTLYGEDTANYVAGRFEELARELRGEAPVSQLFDEPSLADFALEDSVYAEVTGLEPLVASWAKSIPTQDRARVGSVVKSPTTVNPDEMGVPAIHFGWKGGTSDLVHPSVSLEYDTGNGVWKSVLNQDSPYLWLLYSRGGNWEAVWHQKGTVTPGSYRFVVRGLYRSSVAGSSTPDPIWDPEGKNQSYAVVSTAFQVM